jgi:formyl-CoA transferase
MLEQHRLADGTPIKLPGIVPKLSQTPGTTRWLGPQLGAHTDQVLGQLGYSAQDIAALRKDGVV